MRVRFLSLLFIAISFCSSSMDVLYFFPDFCHEILFRNYPKCLLNISHSISDRHFILIMAKKIKKERVDFITNVVRNHWEN